MRLIRSLFKRMPTPGHEYLFDVGGDPFKDSWRVRVTRTQGKYVEYEYDNKKKYGDAKNSMDRSSFHFCFTKANP